MSYTINNISVVPPVGSVVAHTSNTIPTGWLLCNGATYNKSAYPALSTLLVGSYGNTSSGTTFVVPNFQAAFLRGAGTQTYPTTGGTDYGYTSPNNARTINTPQGTSTLTHYHAVNIPTHTHTLTGSSHGHTVNDSKHSHTIPIAYYYKANTKPLDEALGNPCKTIGAFKYADVSAGAGTVGSAAIGNETSTSSNNANLTNTLGDNTNNKNTNETFPFNYAINWIIKY